MAYHLFLKGDSQPVLRSDANGLAPKTLFSTWLDRSSGDLSATVTLACVSDLHSLPTFRMQD